MEERRFKRRVSKSRGRASAPVAPPGLKADGVAGANAALKGRSSTTLLRDTAAQKRPQRSSSTTRAEVEG